MALRRRPTVDSRKSLLDDISELDQIDDEHDSESNLDGDSQVFSEDSTREDHEFLYVLAIDKNAHPITINWLVELLKRNGLNLAKLGKQIRVDHHLYKTTRTEEILLAIAAPLEALKSAAKTMGLTSSRPDDVLRSRHVDLLFADSIYEQEPAPPSNSDSALTRSEKERCLLHILENIQSDQQCKDVLLGYPSVFVYPGQSIIPVCHRERIITRYFPLHNRPLLETLEDRWLWKHQRQPINSIRAYFGESIAFYFAFMELHTIGLVIPTILGLIQFLFFSAEFDAFFSLLSVLYLTVFIKIWKRRSCEYAYEWGTLQSPEIQKPRSMFRAKLMYDNKGRAKLTYPMQRTVAKVYLVSIPIVLLCLYGSVRIMLAFLSWEELVLQMYPFTSDYLEIVMTALPGVTYAATVWLMNRTYQGLAERLTEYENHRTQSSHDAHLIIKLALFEFVNNFGSVFYIAFYVQDIQQVRRQIGSLLLIGQLIENFVEVFVPYLTYYTNIELPLQRRLSTYKKLDSNPAGDRCKFSQEAYTQNHLPEYESTYNDHLEIFIQMGYVFMFASVFPLAALFAFINNIIEIKSDAFKMCRVFQRPNARFAKSINPAWMKCFEVIGLLSVLTFCAHIGISSFMKDLKVQLQLDQTQYVLLIVLIEHLTLAVILIIYYVVPDQPKYIRERFLLQYGEPTRASVR